MGNVNNNDLDFVNRRLEAKDKEIKKANDHLRQLDNERRQLAEQKERLLYHGMLRYEYIDYLRANPINGGKDGITLNVTGYEVTTDYTMKDGTQLVAYSTIYTDQQGFRIHVQTPGGQQRTYDMYTLPKKYYEQAKKMREYAFSEKVVQPI